MRDKIISYLLKKKSKTIVKLCDQIQIISFSILILMAFLVLYLLKTNLPTFFYLVILVVDLLVLSFFFISRGFYQEIIKRLLFEDIDLERFSEVINLRQEFGINKEQRNEYIQAHKLGEGQVLYLKGNFQESISMLRLIDFNKVIRRHQKQYQNVVTYYTYLNTIKQGILGDMTSLNKLSEKDKFSIQAIMSIQDGDTTNYFDNLVPKNHLQFISKNYYSALNALNQNDVVKAKGYFQAITNENPELFYVQEAKNYLKDMTDGRN